MAGASVNQNVKAAAHLPSTVAGGFCSTFGSGSRTFNSNCRSHEKSMPLCVYTDPKRKRTCAFQSIAICGV